MRLPILLILCTSLCAVAAETPEKPADPAVEKCNTPPQPPVVRENQVAIDGKQIPYRVTTGKIQLKQEDGKPRASIFHVSYERLDIEDKSKRPVMFAFNGGPGSSAVWLHLGVLGPRIIRLPGDGTTAPPPPNLVTDNPHSILDHCDLVFVDPVSTGYSRSEKDVKANEFHGLDEDIESVGDFVRRWISEHDRWGSPKYLLGESYGGIRVAGLSQHLQSRYGMALNGVVLLSSLLDFATLMPAPGNDVPHLVFLPSFTATAHHHGKIQGDRDEWVDKSTQFSFGDYAAALLKGAALDRAERTAIAAQLETLTSIPAERWIEHNLRISPSFFRAELLRAEGRVIGRFDSRVAWDTTDTAAQSAEYDPSYSLAYGAISSAMLDYLGRELGYKEDQPYEILTGKVHPWRWNANNSIVNVGNRLATAMRDNPHLRVHVMGGYTDLATPHEGVAHSLRHLPNLPESARGNITSTMFDGGHMFYFNAPDLAKTRTDLLEFLRNSAP
jgi:carboxypeptidase C (cathepsin A)